VLSLIRYHRLRSGMKRVLIAMPHLVNLETWADQIKLHAPDLSFEKLVGDKTTRFELINQNADLYLINYAGLGVYMSELVKQDKSRKRMVNRSAVESFTNLFNAMVLDEIHHLGNPASLIHRLAWQLAKRCEFRYGLTGTLFGRDPGMLQPQFELIDHGHTLGETLGLFRASFFRQQPHYWKGMEYIFEDSKTELLHKFMQHRSLRYEDHECLDLPPMVPITYRLTWGEDQIIYHQRALENYHAEGMKMNPNSYVNLRQISSGFVGYSDMKGERAKLVFKENPKLDRLLQIVDEAPLTSKLVVFHEYIFTGELIRAAMKKAEVEYAELWGGTKDAAKQLRRFLDDPKCRVLVANYVAGGESGNYQEVANYVIFYETPPEPIMRKQAVKRVYRGGQKKRSYIIDLVLPNSIDERILAALEKGQDLYQRICEGKERML
ncbi:MAG: helicase-related protein, partial [Candidatus Dormibacteraceae bacterium]